MSDKTHDVTAGKMTTGAGSHRSNDQFVQDAIEDDDVREVLRTFHKVAACPRFRSDAALASHEKAPRSARDGAIPAP